MMPVLLHGSKKARLTTQGSSPERDKLMLDKVKLTPGKMNTEPENGPLEDYGLILNHGFWALGFHVNLPECKVQFYDLRPVQEWERFWVDHDENLQASQMLESFIRTASEWNYCTYVYIIFNIYRFSCTYSVLKCGGSHGGSTDCPTVAARLPRPFRVGEGGGRRASCFVGPKRKP